MSKHTKGPWLIRIDPFVDGVVITSEARIAASKAPICTIKDAYLDEHDLNEYEAEQAANASLIAASPELLEVLKAFDQAAKESGSIIGFAGKALPLLQQARAAIAKATGEQP